MDECRRVLDVAPVGSSLPPTCVGPAPVFDPLAPTIFHQPWWLSAVTEGNYEEVTVSAGGRTVGRFPYVRTPVFGPHKLCGMPPLTHFLGPAIDEGQGASCNRILRRAQITRDLLKNVGTCTGFWQKLHRGTSDVLPYQELGYSSTVQFTFEVPPLPPKTLWRNMRDKTRNVIRRADEQYTTVKVGDFEAFARFYIANVQQRGQKSYYGASLISRICEAASCRGQGRVLAAKTQSGNMAAAIFYVWDAQAAYYLLSTRSTECSNGAVSLLLWEAIQHISGQNLIFDFDGIITSGSALFFTGFGGQIAPRYVVSRYTLGHRLAGRIANPLRRRSAETYM